jgi:hypothetical protein
LQTKKQKKTKSKAFHPPNPTLVRLLHIYSILPKVWIFFRLTDLLGWCLIHDMDWRLKYYSDKLKCGCTDLIKHWIICEIHTTSLNWIGTIRCVISNFKLITASLFPGCLDLQKDNISYLCFPGWLVIFLQFAYWFYLSSCCHLQNSATVEHFISTCTKLVVFKMYYQLI